MPNERPPSEFRSVQQEANERLYQVYNGPVGEIVPRHIANLCLDASDKIDHATATDGPIHSALNESNVRGMLTWALHEVGVTQEERQALIQKMEQMGIGIPVTVDPAGSIRPEARRSEEDVTRQSGSRGVFMPTRRIVGETGAGQEVRFSEEVIPNIARRREAQRAEMPNERPPSELRSVQQEARNRLYQVYNGPVGEKVSREIAFACLSASDKIDHAAGTDGPSDLALNEINVRGMLTWALDEVGVEREERQALIKKMEEMGIGSPVPVDPAESIRSEARRSEEDVTRQSGSRSASTRSASTMSLERQALFDGRRRGDYGR
jgi:hypothetical protein